MYRKDKADLSDALYVANAGTQSKKGFEIFQNYQKSMRPQTEAEIEKKRSEASIFDRVKKARQNGNKSR